MKKNKFLNLFDFTLIIILIMVGILSAYFLLKRNKYLEITVKITNQNVLYSLESPPSWFTEYFKPGMIVKDSFGRKLVELKKIYRYDLTPDVKTLYLTLNIKADYNKGSGKYSYEGKTLSIGAPIKIEFPDILVEGLVTDISGLKRELKNNEILVWSTLYDVKPYIADNLNIGDNVKDSNGDVAITIIDKKVEPAEKSVPDSLGNLHLSRDPIAKDIRLTFKLNVNKVSNSINNNEYYLFGDIRILVNTVIPVHLGNIDIYPMVNKMEITN